jgi:hypothetical protein
MKQTHRRQRRAQLLLHRPRHRRAPRLLPDQLFAHGHVAAAGAAVRQHLLLLVQHLASGNAQCLFVGLFVGLFACLEVGQDLLLLVQHLVMSGGIHTHV